jgi:hypothetical protein
MGFIEYDSFLPQGYAYALYALYARWVYFPQSGVLARYVATCSMRFMRSMRGGFVFRNRRPSLKAHHGQCLTSMTKHDSGGSPPGDACDSKKPPHGKTQGSVSGWRRRLGPYLPNGHFPKRPAYYSIVQGL